MPLIDEAKRLLRANPDLKATELQELLHCSQNYAYQLRRMVITNGIPTARGPIIRTCLQAFFARPEIVVKALEGRPVAEIAALLTRKLERPITSQYITNLKRLKPHCSQRERRRILALCR